MVRFYNITHTHAGPPSPPEPQLHVLSATAIQISWLPPFSWADYPIVNYTVQVHSRITGEVTNSTVNATITETLSAAVTIEVKNSTLNTTTTESGSATITKKEMDSTTSATSTSATAAPVTFIHNTPHKGIVQNCDELVFSVFAASNIGWSSPAVVTGGFPIGNVCLGLVPRLIAQEKQIGCFNHRVVSYS